MSQKTTQPVEKSQVISSFYPWCIKFECKWQHDYKIYSSIRDLFNGLRPIVRRLITKGKFTTVLYVQVSAKNVLTHQMILSPSGEKATPVTYSDPTAGINSGRRFRICPVFTSHRHTPSEQPVTT